jgi:hypothetical protein
VIGGDLDQFLDVWYIFTMKRRDFLEKWGLSSLKIKLGFLEGAFRPQDPDRGAAWELYVELLTRVTSQYLPLEDGDEEAALQSVFVIFPPTREILHKLGSGAGEFAKLDIPVLNQIIRPSTAKWHRRSLGERSKTGALSRISCRATGPAAAFARLHPRLRRYSA